MKRVFIYTAAAVLFLSGCSGVNVPDKEPGSQEWLDDTSLPVPVMFSGMGMSFETRAGIIDGQILADGHLGIFGLSVSHNDDGTVSPKWNPGVDGQILLENAEAFTDSYGNLSLSETAYYPMDNRYTYSFYAYYPYNVNSTFNSADYIVTYTDEDGLGNIDILYAYDDAESVDGVNGFNADYIRHISGDDANLPHFHLEHKVAALNFVARLAPDATVSNVTISGIEILDAPVSADLYIATRATERTELGKILAMKYGPVSLLKPSGNGYTDQLDVVPTEDGAELGTFLLVPSTYKAESGYRARVHLVYENGETDTVEANIPCPEGNFQLAKQYTVYLTVRSADSVTFGGTSVGSDDIVENW